MNYIELLGNNLFKKGEFFYELHENNLFVKSKYLELIQWIHSYKNEILEDQYVNKEVMRNILVGINILSGIEYMERNGEIVVKGLSDQDDLNDYFNELFSDICMLLS